MFNYLVTLSGVGFYPSQLSRSSQLNITSQKDSNKLNKLGKKTGSGYVSIEGIGIQELYDIVMELKKETPAITGIEFSIIRYYENQCNIELSNHEIKLISSLSAHLCISCSKNS